MTPVVIIPARLAASRLPNKPLADIGGHPMVVQAMRRALEANIGPVLVAAGDQDIVNAVQDAGGKAILTDPALPSGTDRVLKALELFDPSRKHDVVVNVQGDMPFVDPGMLKVCSDLVASDISCDMSTLVAPIVSAEDVENEDVVKAIVAGVGSQGSGRALYFTRGRPYGSGDNWRHIGIYGYRRSALERFCREPPSELERRERLEQLRALELGMVIRVGGVKSAPISVDNIQDLEKARRYAEQQ